MRRFLILFVAAFFCVHVSGQIQNEKNKAYEVFQSRGEVFFSFDMPLEGKKSLVLKQISVDNIKDGQVFAYANRKEFETIADHVSGLKILTAPSLEKPIKMAVDLREVQAWNAYPTYDQYVAMMDSFVNAHPTLCHKESIGTTVNGRELLILKISDNVTQKEAEPEFLYSSTMHGDELTGAVLLLRLADYLLSNYGTNAEVTNMVNNSEIWINPLANPDGTYFLSNNSISGAIRYNGNFVDLNRNFPDTQNGDHPDGNDWQPETVAWMAFLTQHHFVMSANFHGGAEVMNYPWDKFTQLHADDDWLQLVSREYVDTVHVYNNSGYFTDINDGITNGNAWYEIDGGRQDYITYFHHGRDITIEISNDKNPPANQLPNFWTWNWRSLMNYIKQVQYGVHGIVTDSLTGEPLHAFVEVLQHDIDSSQVYSDLPHGDYYRLIKGGNYNLRFSSPGYITKTINNVSVVDFQATVLDVQLAKVTQTSVFTESDFAEIFPNPSSGKIVIKTNRPFSYNYELYAPSGKLIKKGTSNNSSIDITGQPEGIYFIRITSESQTYVSKIVLKNEK